MADHKLVRKGEVQDGIVKKKKALDQAAKKLKAQDKTTESRSGDMVSSQGRGKLAHGASSRQVADALTSLQDSHGNAFVQRLLRSKAIQAKLTVNSPNDVYEKEADAVGEAVAKASVVQRQEEEEEELQMKRTDSLQRQVEEEEEELQMKRTDSLQRQVEEEEEELQAKGDGNQVPEVSSELEGRIDAARGSGESLPNSIRSSFEPQFGRDFSDVRVHAGSEADDLSQQLGAKAFTTGSDIFFRSGDYQPDSSEGRQLLGHEMTHVVQQDGAPIARKAVETEEKAAPNAQKDAELELTDIKARAVGSMSQNDIRALILQAARCQQLGLDQPAQNAIDDAGKQALLILKRRTDAFDVGGSSWKMARDLMGQLATVQLLGAEGADKTGEQAWAKLLGWAQARMTDAIKQLQRDPTTKTVQDVLEKASLVQMLGGDSSPAMAAIQNWRQVEQQ